MTGTRGQEASSSIPGTRRLVCKLLQRAWKGDKATVTFRLKADLQCQILSPPSSLFGSRIWIFHRAYTLLCSQALLCRKQASLLQDKKLFITPQTAQKGITGEIILGLFPSTQFSNSNPGDSVPLNYFVLPLPLITSLYSFMSC